MNNFEINMHAITYIMVSATSRFKQKFFFASLWVATMDVKILPYLHDFKIDVFICDGDLFPFSLFSPSIFDISILFCLMCIHFIVWNLKTLKCQCKINVFCPIFQEKIKKIIYLTPFVKCCVPKQLKMLIFLFESQHW